MVSAPATAPALDLEGGLWLPIAEIARLKNKSRQAIAKRVAALELSGMVASKPGAGGRKLVNVAQYDRAVGEVGDVAREMGAATKADLPLDAPPDASASAQGKFRDAATREKEYAADIKFLDREERLKTLIPVKDIEDAAAKAAEAMVRVIDRLPTHAERVAGAVGKDGPSGARTALKEIAREIRQSIADAMGGLAGAALPAAIDTEAQGPMALDDAEVTL